MMTDQATAHPSERHNLPQPTTSFIGRADEVRAVRDLFERHRLVTLAGPGGTVKDPPAARTCVASVVRLGSAVSALVDGERVAN